MKCEVIYSKSLFKIIVTRWSLAGLTGGGGGGIINGLAVRQCSTVFRLKILSFLFLRWRLQKAFFSPENTGCLGCAGISVNDIIPFCSCADDSEWEKLDKGYVTLGRITICF